MANQKVRYTGQASIRKISAADFKSVGVEDQNQIEVAGSNMRDRVRKNKMGTEVEVSEAAAKYLTENEDFELVENDSTKSADATSSPADKTKTKTKTKG